MTRRRCRVLLASVVLALVGAVACATIGRFFMEKPKVTLARVGVQNPTAQGVTMVFGILVENPNSFALKVDRVSYTAEVDGAAVTSGTLENLKEIPAHDKAVVDVPIALRYTDVLSSLLGLVQNKSSHYRVHGDAAFGMLSVPFDEKGQFNL